MPSPEQGHVLVVRVWFHDGVPVARILADPRPGRATAEGSAAEPPEDSTTVAGNEAIIAAVSDWVTGLDPPG